MRLTPEQMTGGLTPEHDLVFAGKPGDPEMRESTSMWLFEENGAFGFPRVGIEAEASSWERRRYQANVALAGGRVLIGPGIGAAHSPLGPECRPTVLGAGPLSFRCIEPFRKWRVIFDGDAVDGAVAQQIANTLDAKKRTPVRFDVELDMVTPAWVQDISPGKVAQMSAAERIEAANMGLGWRFEHLFRAAGRFELDGQSRDFRAVGLRIVTGTVIPVDGGTWASGGWVRNRTGQWVLIDDSTT